MTASRRATSRLAIASFLFSLASFVAGPLGFVPGIVCGHLARRRLARDPSLEDPGFASAGLILGYVFLAITTIVAAIVSLTLLGAFTLQRQGTDGRAAAAEITLDTLETYLDQYREHLGTYPTTRQGLDALARKPAVEPVPERWKYFLPAQYFSDPWGNPIQYRCPGIRNPHGYDLWSRGPDGEPGTEDDIIAR